MNQEDPVKCIFIIPLYVSLDPNAGRISFEKQGLRNHESAFFPMANLHHIITLPEEDSNIQCCDGLFNFKGFKVSICFHDVSKFSHVHNIVPINQ